MIAKRPADTRHKIEVQNGDITVPPPLPTLRKLLLCTVCELVASPPLHMCHQGHNVCGGCQPKLDKCRSCNSSITLIRNLAVEAIIETSAFACDNFEQGCSLAVTGRDLNAHRKECGFRPVQCHLEYYDNCKHSKIQISDFLSHLLTVHRIKECQLHPKSRTFFKVFKVTTKEPRHHTLILPGSYMSYEGQVFITRSAVSHGVFNFGLATLSSDADAKMYSVELQFGLPGKAVKKTFKATIPVHTIRTTNAQFIDSCIRVSISRGMIEQFSVVSETDDKKPILEWEIEYKIMTEVKDEKK